MWDLLDANEVRIVYKWVLKIAASLCGWRGGKSGTHFQNDCKNIVLFYHLQFQYWFMQTQLQLLQDSTRIDCLQIPFHQHSPQIPHPASSPPIMSKEDEPPETIEGPKQLSKGTKSPLELGGSNQQCCSVECLNKRSQIGIQLGYKIGANNQVEHKQNCEQNNQRPCRAARNKNKPLFQDEQNERAEFQNSSSKSKLQRKNSKKRKKQKKYNYEEEAYCEESSTFKFPFVNEYLRNHSQEYLSTIKVFDKTQQTLYKTDNDTSININTFINCDVKYFNWNLFVEEVGKFEVVLIDPPWRIKGAQQNDSQFMFSNCRFSLQYNTMANKEIKKIPLHILSDQGFIFLWILNSQLDASLEIMEKWGYQLVEQVIWVKLKDKKINLTHGYYFMHSYEVCLVGYKCKKEQNKKKELKLRQGVSWNTIFAEVRQKSQKPEDLYALIDIMFKGGKKIQIFARNHNRRLGIFSVGNQLGESYDKWNLKLQCDGCEKAISFGEKRFKSKRLPNFDLCQKCITHQEKTQFFQLNNDVDQNIKHEYIACNHCGVQPIWGIRFQCITCHDFDVCENCFDQNLNQQSRFHPLEHQFNFLVVPVFGNGFHIHEFKCASCFQQPIIGIYFNCLTCKNFKLCQKCYFERDTDSSSSLMKRHKPDHQMEVIFESQIQQNKRYECFSCRREVLQNCWMCENCYNFFFCQKCYEQRRQFKSLYANTHKNYHVLTKIF